MAQDLELRASLDHHAGDQGLVCDAGISAQQQTDGLIEQHRYKSVHRRQVEGRPLVHRQVVRLYEHVKLSDSCEKHADLVEDLADDGDSSEEFPAHEIYRVD